MPSSGSRKNVYIAFVSQTLYQFIVSHFECSVGNTVNKPTQQHFECSVGNTVNKPPQQLCCLYTC